MWDCNSGKVLSSTLRHGAAIRSCALTSNPATDGEYPLTGDGDGRWKVWDVESSKCEETVEPHPNWKPSDGPSLQGWNDPKSHHSGKPCLACMGLRVH